MCCEVVSLQTVRTIFKVEWAELSAVDILHRSQVFFVVLENKFNINII